jgi:hypothetical protein
LYTIESNLWIQCNAHQNSNIILYRNRKSILKFIWKNKRPQISKSNLEKKSNAGDTTIPNFKLYYRTIITKTEWYWPQNRHKDQ